MNIVQEHTGELEAVLKVELSNEDYQERVSRELKSMQRKARIPGFRPGKVPFGMIQKMYGKSVLVEEVNKVLGDAVFSYIKENKLNIVGHPVADHKKAETIDWDNITGFTFEYKVGLAPEVILEISSAIEVEYLTIKVDDNMVDSYLMDIRKRYGKMSSPDVSEAEDVLYGLFEELDADGELKPEGKAHKSNLYIQYLKDETLKGQLLGVSAGKSIDIDLMKAVESATEAASMIGVKKEELGNYNPVFRFTLESISRVEPAELNTELYDKVVPGMGIITEEAFKGVIRDQIKQQYQTDIDKNFKNDVRKKLIEITNLPLPERFLKTWLLDAHKDEFTPEQIDQEFDNLADTFRWQLIENHIIKQYELKVTPEEINNHLGEYFRAQMKQYGQEDVEQEVIDDFIKNIASKEDEMKKVYDHLYDQKLLGMFKDNLSLKETELSFDEFVKVVSEKYSKEAPDAGHDHSSDEHEDENGDNEHDK
jgi:trigger factor